MDRKQPIERIALVEDSYAESFGRQRFTMTLMILFAAIAVVMSGGGLFGVLSRLVALRTREIGVRVALGATPRRVVWLVAGRGIGLAALGMLLGMTLAASLARVLDSLLVGVGRYDPVSFGAMALVVMAVAIAATWVPSRRASRLDPAVALRAE